MQHNHQHQLRQPTCWRCLCGSLPLRLGWYLPTGTSAERALRSGRAALGGRLRRAQGIHLSLEAARVQTPPLSQSHQRCLHSALGGHSCSHVFIQVNMLAQCTVILLRRSRPTRACPQYLRTLLVTSTVCSAMLCSLPPDTEDAHATQKCRKEAKCQVNGRMTARVSGR